MRRQTSQMTDTSSPGSSIVGSDDEDGATACGDSSGDDDTDNSEESNAWPPLRQVRKFKRKSRYYAAKRWAADFKSNNKNYNKNLSLDAEATVGDLGALIWRWDTIRIIKGTLRNGQLFRWPLFSPREHLRNVESFCSVAIRKIDSRILATLSNRLVRFGIYRPLWDGISLNDLILMEGRSSRVNTDVSKTIIFFPSIEIMTMITRCNCLFVFQVERTSD